MARSSGQVPVRIQSLDPFALHKEAFVRPAQQKTGGSLRPAGRVQIGEQLVDAQTQGDFIERGTAVRVVEILGNAVVVEAVSEEAHV